MNNLHGTFISIYNVGTLLVGESGCGKSETALALIEKGHSLIADDSTEFYLDNNSGELIGQSPLKSLGYMEVKGLGILDVTALFGARALIKNHPLQLIIQLEKLPILAAQNPLNKMTSNRNILGINIPQIILPISIGRNVSLLIECLVKDHLLNLQGYNANIEFLQQYQQQVISNESQHSHN